MSTNQSPEKNQNQIDHQHNDEDEIVDTSNSLFEEDEQIQVKQTKIQQQTTKKEEVKSNNANQKEQEYEIDISKQHYKEISPHLKQKLLRKRKICGLVEGCDFIENYEKLNKIHEGVYGVVYRAVDKLTGEICAIKKVKINREKEKEGFPITSIREFNILLAMNHPNVVHVSRVVVGSNLDKIFMVMEYMDHELKDLISNNKYQFSESEIKCLMKQLLDAVDYIHSKNIMHRDLKTSNILYNNKGQLKVCDFGLGRKLLGNQKEYTPVVVTLWYRAPEVLLGCSKYTTALDVWSVGCIMAELFTKDPLIKGDSEMRQIELIFQLFGTPNEETWPGVKELKNFPLFAQKRYQGCKLADKIKTQISEEGLDLLSKLLALDPKKRITANKALQHPWFAKQPKPLSLELMPTFPGRNEISREEREKNKQNQ